MRPTLLLIMTALVALGAGAKAGSDNGLKSVAAKRALLKRDRALEQAEAAYRKAAAEANKAVLAELKKAKDAAFASKDADEVNTVTALISETEQELERAAGKAAVRKRLAIDPTKGTWEGGTGLRGTYRADGTVRFDSWPADGRWEPVGPYTITMRDGNGKECTITFTADGRHNLWVFSDGAIGWAQRAE